MKKSIIILGAIAVVLLMLSSATAVPTTSSEPVMEKIEIKEIKAKLSNNLDIDIVKILLKILAFPAGWAYGFTIGRVIIFIEAIADAILWFFDDLKESGLSVAIKNLMEVIPRYILVIVFSGIIFGLAFVQMVDMFYP